MLDVRFDATLSPTELEVWNSLKEVCSCVLGKSRSSDHQEIVDKLMKGYEKMQCNMSFKIHLLNSHLSFFHDNLCDVSDEHGERFHKDIARMETRYHGKSNQHMLSDYCWTLITEEPNVVHRRSAPRCSFQNPRP